MKKIKNLWTIPCQSSTVDATSNNLSLINIVEQIQIGKHGSNGKIAIPERGESAPINFQIISLWERLADLQNDIPFDVEIHILDPESKVLSKNNLTFLMPKGKERTRSIINISGFKITIPGKYSIEIYARDNSKSKFEKVSESSITIQFSLK